jgi:hypothetical protein
VPEQLGARAQKTLEILMCASTENMTIAGARLGYCWALLQQGRFEDAKMQYELARETMKSLEKRFDHSKVLGYLTPARVKVGKEFDMRLDLINVAKNPGILVKVEGLVPVEFKVTAMHPKYILKNSLVELEKKTINPFTDEAITFTVKATKPGDFTLNPQLTYVDDLGETKTCKIDPVTITVHSPSK